MKTASAVAATAAAALALGLALLLPSSGLLGGSAASFETLEGSGGTLQRLHHIHDAGTWKAGLGCQVHASSPENG